MGAGRKDMMRQDLIATCIASLNDLFEKSPEQLLAVR